MAYLGKVTGRCSEESIVHTRIDNCDINPGRTKAILETSINFTFPINNSADFIAAIKDGILHGQVTPINGISGADATGGEVQNYTTPYQENRPTGTAPVSIPFVLGSGGTCLFKELMQLNGKMRRIVEIDMANIAWGEAISDVEGRGYLGYVYATETRAMNPTTPQINYFNVSYTANHENELLNRFGLEANATFDGLMGVVLQQTATAGQMRIVNPCTGTDVGIEYAADWKVGAFVDNTGAPPQSATMNEDTGILTIAPTTGSFRIVGAAQLDAMNIVGLDGLNQFVSAAANTAS